MSIFKKGVMAVAAAALLVGMAGRPAQADNPKVTFGLPLLSLTFSYAFLAQQLGYWKDQGLDVDVSFVPGPVASQALLAGDITFANLSGTDLLAAVAHGQPAMAIASPHQQILVDLILSKAAVAKTGLTVENSTVVQRAKALKGMTIGIDGPNTILDAYLEHIVAKGGLTPQKDVITVVTPAPAANAMMEQGRADGFSMSAPWSQIAQTKGTGVLWVSAVRGDLPELSPFAFNTISARADFCPKSPDICRKFLTGVKQAMDFMNKDPDKALALIAPKFANMDPAVLKLGFDQQRAALTPGIAYTEKQFQNTQDFAVDAGILKPSEKRTSFAGVVYSNEYSK